MHTVTFKSGGRWDQRPPVGQSVLCWASAPDREARATGSTPQQTQAQAGGREGEIKTPEEPGPTPHQTCLTRCRDPCGCLAAAKGPDCAVVPLAHGDKDTDAPAFYQGWMEG